jgi:crotonobetainyl-CoA:carnitine CoA-transferase CaiB-like acyl-CoA transferase
MTSGAESKTTAAESDGPLAGIRVIDLTVALAGPYCTLLLAGLGAEVIKIDAPGGSDIARLNPPYVGPKGLHYERPGRGDMSLSAVDRLRCKKSVTLDLKTDRGREVFMDLAKCSDILVENMSEGAADRLGIGYETVHTVNPALVYASLTAFGDHPDYVNVKGMDPIIQAASGLMEVNGFSDGPPCRVGLPLGDLAGSQNALSGILAALFLRTRTGRGQRVVINLLDSLVGLLAVEHFDLIGREGKPLRTGNSMDRVAPFGAYRTANGYVAIAAPADDWAHSLFGAMGMPELASDERFRTRGARATNCVVLNQLVEGWTQKLSSEEVVTVLTLLAVPAAKVRSPNDALHDPVVRSRRAVVPLRYSNAPDALDVMGPGVPMSFSESTVGLDVEVVELGAHNEEVFSGLLGIEMATLQDLQRQGVI